ncbi:MAG: hypothetical protein H6548_07890 [Chitinophagales bacterium]|nr:hypothetical protein [Chitinophagales bacterium]HAE13456.1 hypothetical protein [Bacteroidota bacterium]MCB9022022.1 hypothetical protein [Chitinophagales bacterium]MCB9031751.1 hypothetical protein [Chitinophagales bacterium]HQU38242.1 hypothetical protein [Chitinophagales bacterium]
MKKIRLSLLLPVIALSACRTGFDGNLLDNQAPDTHTVADTIIRFGDDRLESEVVVRWWGDDPDGVVAGYEFTFGDPYSLMADWQFTERQDSTFILAPPAGTDTLDFYFSVRAIDQEGLRDPSPATLAYPVKNSPPSVAFQPGLNQPVISFPALTFYWEGSDPDGDANLNGYEVVWNDTTVVPVPLEAGAGSLLLVADDPAITSMTCNMYVNASATPLATSLSGMQAHSWNKLFIRAVDQSGAYSPWTASDSVYIKPVQSNILLVNAYTTASNPTDFYGSHLVNNGFTVLDTIDLFETAGGNYTQQSADNLTQEKVFAMFDCLIWYSNSAESSLSLGQRTTSEFFDKGGHLLMSVYVSGSFDPLSNFLDFTPVSSLVSPADTTLLLEAGALLTPTDDAYPDLQATAIVGVVKPVNLQIGAAPVYEAALTAKDNATLTFSPWTGGAVVMARKPAAGEADFILSTLELQKLDGLLNMDDFFNKIMTDAFGY